MSHPSLIQILSSVAVIVALSTSAQAKNIKCWKDKNGIRECGAVVPPEYSQSRIEIVNDRGLVIKVIEAAKTPEELEREHELKRLQKDEEDLRKERERLDAVLLNAYTTERDLNIARDTNLKAAQGQIDISKGNLKLLEANFADAQKRAANFERTGQKPPPKLIEEMKTLREQIRMKKLYIEKKEALYKEMQERFERDLKRFRELKSGRLN